MGVCNILVNIGNEGVDVHDGYLCVDCKLSLAMNI